MSKLSDAIAAVDAEVTTETATVQAHVATLVAKIAELQALVDAGGATQADFDALMALQAKIAAIDPTNPATI